MAGEKEEIPYVVKCKKLQDAMTTILESDMFILTRSEREILKHLFSEIEQRAGI